MKNRIDRKIIVILEKSKGLGDISFAKKLYDILNTKYPNISSELFAIDQDAKDGLKSFGIKTKIWNDVLTKYKNDKTLIIHCPVLEQQISLPNENSILWKFGHYSTMEIINSSNGELFKSGLGEDELGIFFDENLYSYMQNLYQKGQDFDLKNLLSISDINLRSYFEKNIHNYEEEQLFFGYSTRLNSVAKFSLLCTEFEKSKNISICIPGNRSQKELQAFFELLENCKDHFLANEISKINIISLTDISLSKVIILNSKPSRSLTFIVAEQLKHADMLQLFKSTHPISLVTGDQSLTEAISAGKILIIEPHIHQQLAMKNLCIYANNINPSFYKFLLLSSFFLMDEINFKINDFEDLKKDFRELSQHIYSNANLERNFCKMIDFFIHTKI